MLNVLEVLKNTLNKTYRVLGVLKNMLEDPMCIPK